MQISDAFRNRPKQVRQQTVARLRAGIEAIESRSERVTADSIKRESGLDFTSIRRNPEAYALYRQHAHAFKNTRNPSRRKPTRRRRQEADSGRDRLLSHSKTQLCAKVHALTNYVRELERLLAARAVTEQTQAVEVIALRTRLEQATRAYQAIRQEYTTGRALS